MNITNNARRKNKNNKRKQQKNENKNKRKTIHEDDENKYTT